MSHLTGMFGIGVCFLAFSLLPGADGETKQSQENQKSGEIEVGEKSAEEVFKQKIRRLIVLEGGGLSAKQQLLQGMRITIPGGSDEFYEILISDDDVELFIEMLVPIYKKHFTVEEIDASIAFYETALGQQIAKKQQLLVADVMKASFDWGQKLGPKIMDRLMERDWSQFEGKVPEAIRNIKEARLVGNETLAIATLRRLTMWQRQFRDEDLDKDDVLDYATSLKELADAGLLDDELAAGKKSGYAFSLSGGTFEWQASATPTAESIGARNFVVCPNGVVRYSKRGPANCDSSAIE